MLHLQPNKPRSVQATGNAKEKPDLWIRDINKSVVLMVRYAETRSNQHVIQHSTSRLRKLWHSLGQPWLSGLSKNNPEP